MDEQTGQRCHRIVVRGRFGERLCEFELDFKAGQSSLTSSYQDQAELHGRLDRRRNLGIQLVSISGEEPRP